MVAETDRRGREIIAFSAGPLTSSKFLANHEEQ